MPNSDCSDWLISEYQSVNPSREAISILSTKYVTFVHLVTDGDNRAWICKRLDDSDTLRIESKARVHWQAN